MIDHKRPSSHEGRYRLYCSPVQYHLLHLGNKGKDMTQQPETDKERLDLIFFDYLENRRRQLLSELRDIERHLLNAGRITQPSLKPVRER